MTKSRARTTLRTVTVKASATGRGIVKRKAESIKDFKIVNGLILYHVKRIGTYRDDYFWETEQSIEAPEMLKAFQDHVQATTGYSLTSTIAATNDGSVNNGDSSPSKRPGRSSKVRAIFRLCEDASANMDVIGRTTADSDDSDDVDTRTSKKRKRTQTISRKKPTNSTRPPRGQALVRLQRELIEKRKTERALWLENNDWHDHSFTGTDCCLRCSIKGYRLAVETNSLARLKTLVNATRVYPSWRQEDIGVHEDNVLVLALSYGNLQMVQVLQNHNESSRIQLSTNLTTYGSNTGFVSRFTFGRAVRSVNESRGNRQGNSAFYRTASYDSFNVDIKSSAYNYVEYLAVLHSPSVNKPSVINCLQQMNSNEYTNNHEYMYYLVASGNLTVAAKLFKDAADSNGYNILHHAVLVEKELPPHRKNQILKKPYSCHNLSPYLSSAINTSADHLKTLYEQLEPAERVETDEFARTVAHFAAVSTTPDCVEYLISQGFNFSQGDKFRLTPLIQAARFGRAKNIRPILRYLSNDVFPCPDFVNQTLLRNRRRPIHYAANFGHSDACKELIDCGATVDAVDSVQKATPLMLAAQRGHLECVKTLVEYGHAGIHLVDKFSRSPLHLACMDGHYQVAKYLLLQGLDADGCDSSNNTPAHYAAAFGHMEILKLLIDFGHADPSFNNVWRATPCSVANLKGHVAIVQYLLELPGGRVDVNFKDQDGLTMLHHAVVEKVTNVNEIDQNLRRIKVILDNKANVNSTTIDGDTVLHALSKSSYYSAHRLEQKLNNQKVREDDEICIEYQQKVARLILEAGADIHAKNAAEETPLAIAMSQQNLPLVAIFIENGARYWSDISQSGNTFFHGLLYGSAQLDNIMLDDEASWSDFGTIQQRHISILDDIWKAIEARPVPEDQINEIKIDHANDEGFSPLLYGIREVVTMQRAFVAKQKSIVKKQVSPQHHNRFGANSETATNEQKRNVRFSFDFHYFFVYAKKLFDRFRPNMCAMVTLPKDYLKKHPKAKVEDYPYQTGYNVLHLASHTQNVALIEFLFSYGANPNQQVMRTKDLTGKTPLIFGYFTRQNDTSLYLDGDKTISAERANKLFNILMPSFENDLYDSISVYIKYGADPCLPDENGLSALMKAAKALDGKAVQLMCHASTLNANSTTCLGLENRDKTGMTALMMAISSYEVQYRQSEDKAKIDMNAITQLCYAGADVNATYENGDTVAMKTLRLDYYPLLETLIQSTQGSLNHTTQNEAGENLLIVACKGNNPEVVNRYLECLSNDFFGNKMIDISDYVNVVDKQGNSPLAMLSSRGNLTAVKTLLSHQANPNNIESKNIPLLEAIKNKHQDVVEALLVAGADANCRDSVDGSYALHYAVKTEKIAFVRTLLKHGASADLFDVKGQTALHWAIELSKSQTNRSMRVERLLLQSGADINAKDIFGRTPLHIMFTGLNVIPWMAATSQVHKKVTKLIAEKSLAQQQENKIKQYVNEYGKIEADIDTWLERHKRLSIEQEEAQKKKNDNDNDDEIVLSDDDRLTLAKYLDFSFEQDMTLASFDPVDMLKEFVDEDGIDMDSPDAFGRTPFHYAVIVDALSCMNMLLDTRKVNANFQDNDKNGGIQLALRYGHSNIAVIIHNRGGNDSDIVFPNGDKVSIIKYSLTYSYMNVSYLFMSNTDTVLNSLSDSLERGKFHFADTLLRKASDDVLQGIITGKNQNLWHVISNFKPFDVEMWDDYLPEFLERLTSLDLALFADSNNCTPLHYAALNGQETLLKHILTLDPHPATIVDITNGHSQARMAVDSNSVKCVKLLLDTGVGIISGDVENEKSALLQAVSNNNLEMVTLLLAHGVPLDNDSEYGRCNAVMLACCRQKTEILQALVDAGANVDTHSTTMRQKNGKEYPMKTAPLFVASLHSSNEVLKILLKANADTNVIGPDDENVESGRSCLMYNVVNHRVDNVKLLLEHGADLNFRDHHSPRTAFYQVFFEKSKLACKTEIYEMMFNHTPAPNVNLVDEENGMVPLELAIRKHDVALADRLLVLGADPNVKSCKKKQESTDLYTDAVNALFHCVLHDDLNILKVICDTTKIFIDWTAVDAKGRTIFSRLVDINDGYGYKNVDFLNYLVKQTGKPLYKELVEIPDNHGYRATHIAKFQNRTSHYNSLVRLGATPIKVVTHREEDEEAVDNHSMDLEDISLETMEKDAESERVLLQVLAEKKKKKKKQAPPTTDKNKIVIDHYSQLGKIGTIVFDDGIPYDIMIMKVDVGSSLYSCNMFYKMSVIYNKLLDLYVLWTRWGSFGEEGMHQKTPYLTQQEAVDEFKSIFRSKTGNLWEDHLTNFVEKPGRYQLIKARDPAKDAILDNVDLNFKHNEIQPTRLPKNLHNTMKLFCDFETLKNAYRNIKLDIPIGQVPPESIREATKIMTRLKEINKALSSLPYAVSASQKAQQKELIHEAIQESSKYYRLLPMNNPNDRRGLKPILGEEVNTENSRLNNARYINFTLNVVLAAKHRANEINPFDYSYQTLGCKLTEVTPDCRDFNVVSKYMTSTSMDSGYEITHLFAVNRDGEDERYRPFASHWNRKLLWHGSQLGNFMGILNQGLRSKPSTADHSGSLFGNGIYFADMFCKSIDFATNVYGTKNPAYGLLLLCEVALGKECEVTRSTLHKYTSEKEEKQYTSIKGVGKKGPNLSNSLYDSAGVMIPMGPAVDLKTPEDTIRYYDPRTTYNEYIVEDEARVKIRYMVLVRHNKYCFLCQQQQSSENLKNLEDHKFKSVSWNGINSFEQEVFNMYLSDINKTPKQYFDEKLPNFLENQTSYESLHNWSLTLDIERTSKVCQGCANKVATIMLTKELKELHKKYGNNQDDSSKYPFFKLEGCDDGRQCKLQHNKLAHSKQFQHWADKEKEGQSHADEQETSPTENDDQGTEDEYAESGTEQENTDQESEEEDE